MGTELQRSLSNPVPWKDMFHTISLSKAVVPSSQEQDNSDIPGNVGNRDNLVKKSSTDDVNREDNLLSHKPGMDPNRLKAINFQLALYIAMAHAGLLLLICTMFGVGLLLKDFWKPIQWAVLCSITLRQIQGTLVKFWEPPLRQGLLETLLALPLATCKAVAGTFSDAHVGISWIFGKSDSPLQVGFLKLFQWLVTLAALTVGYDIFGPHALVTAMFTGFVTYAGISSFGFLQPQQQQQESHETGPSHQMNKPPIINKMKTRSFLTKVFGWAVSPLRMLNKHSTRFVAARLPTIVAIGVIVIMLLGTLSGLVLFSYKVGLEAKDAVVGLKNHVQDNNYTDDIRHWLDNSNVPEMFEQHSTKAYETISQHIDSFAIQYNLTEFTDAGKEYILGLAHRRPEHIPANTNSHPVLVRLKNARVSMRDYNFSGIYAELEAAFFLLLDHFQLKPEDVKDKVKQMSETGVTIGKRVFSSGSVLVSGGTSMLLVVASSIASGAAGIFNFFTQAAVFFSVLYYLMTSETGGVTEQLLGMVPLSQATRVRCATVLNRAVSSVLLATVKSAFYQGAFTWVLFRFFNIHFLYVSTLLAITIAVLPILPCWLASLPAAAQLAFQGNYVGAVVLTAVHFLVVDFGNRAIHNEIPGHNEYLAGLSIAGGMALFKPALEGAIMGPLLMTVLIALKNLYCEFVLNPEILN